MQSNKSDEHNACDPFLSVVIPLYNKELSVERAITSVLSQQYRNFELLVIDDGSTDQSYARVVAFSDPRVRVIRQTNQGVAAARNQGMLHANGRYLSFLDADDEYLPGFLHQIVALIKQDPEAALYSCSFEVVDEKGRKLKLRSGYTEDFSGPVTEFFRAYRQNRCLICASSFAISREHLLALGGFPVGVRIGEDIFVWLKAALTGPVMHSGRPAAVVYQNAENRTIHIQQQELAWHLVYFLQDRHWLKDLPSEKVQQVDQFLRHNVLVSALGALRFGRRDVAQGYAQLIRPHSFLLAAVITIASYLPLHLFAVIRFMRNRLSTRKNAS